MQQYRMQIYMLSPAEERILKKIGENNLITKIELKDFLRNNGGAGKDITAILETACRGLTDKNLISTINPVGSTCFVITQRGSKLLKDIS